jgi:hypothetical protein
VPECVDYRGPKESLLGLSAAHWYYSKKALELHTIGYRAIKYDSHTDCGWNFHLDE